MKIKALIGLILLIPVLIYVWMNDSPVPIHFLKWEYAVPQALLVLSSLLVGVILGLLLSHAWRNKEKNLQKKNERKARKLQKTEEKLLKQQEKEQKTAEKKSAESTMVSEENQTQDRDQV